MVFQDVDNLAGASRGAERVQAALVNLRQVDGGAWLCLPPFEQPGR
jgi:hypothetical protein